MGEEVDGDSAAEHFGKIARSDGNFAQEPVGNARPFGIPIAAALGEILAGDDTEAGGDDLEEDGHEGGESDDPEEVVFEGSAGGEIGSPVAGVHVTDADQQRGPDVGAYHCFQKSASWMWDGDGAVSIPSRGEVIGLDGGPFNGRLDQFGVHPHFSISISAF